MKRSFSKVLQRPMKSILSVAAFSLSVLLCANVQAQDMKELLEERPELSAGIYRSYDEPVCGALPQVKAPKGYEPFYISHYGRHGSRWHSSEYFYKRTMKVLEEAEGAGVLTSDGKEVLEIVRTAIEDADGRYGDLSPRGVREHRGIAERMYKAYPEVFQPKKGEPAKVESRSTIVVRCILSMAAFNERLKELQPDLQMTRESSKRNMYYMGNRVRSDEAGVFKTASHVRDSLINVWIEPDRFVSSMISDPAFAASHISNPQRWMYDAFMVAGILQDVDYLGLDLYDYFTTEELYDLWKCINANCYLTLGPSPRFGDIVISEAVPLLENIITTADEVIAGKRDLAASLRFGHDTNVVPLVQLIGEKSVLKRVSLDDLAENWNLSFVSPMATNVQFIFFRNKKGNVKVRVLYNEKDAQLPVEGAPFYDWDVLRAHLENRIASYR